MTHPGPYDVISDTLKAEDREVASDYRLFFRRLVFFAAFAAFFLRFAIAALLAMIDPWRVSHQCSRESTCTALRLLQHNEKNSV